MFEVVRAVFRARCVPARRGGSAYFSRARAYRDLSVEQLGSIYERLLEHEVVREDDEIVVRPNVFARKGSGSYYTPDDLVRLILKETIEPLVQARMDAFAKQVKEITDSKVSEGFKRKALAQVDPAEKLLDLKICDPAS